jgi:hypothetical protein
MLETDSKNHNKYIFSAPFLPSFCPFSAITSFAKIFAKIFLGHFPSISTGKLAALKFRFALKLLQIALSITLLLFSV